MLAANDMDGVVYLWPVPARHVLRILGGQRTSNTTTVAFSSTGNILATGESNDQVYLWNPVTGRLTHPAPQTLTSLQR